MKWNPPSKVFLVFPVVLVLGCAAGTRQAQPSDAVQAELVARSRALQDEISKTDSVSVAQRQAFERLAADVGVFNPSGDGSRISLARMNNSGSGTCSGTPTPEEIDNECDTFDIQPGRFCLLDMDESFCDTGGIVCVYRCINELAPSGDLAR
jgi:hypothetical protein